MYWNYLFRIIRELVPLTSVELMYQCAKGDPLLHALNMDEDTFKLLLQHGYRVDRHHRILKLIRLSSLYKLFPAVEYYWASTLTNAILKEFPSPYLHMILEKQTDFHSLKSREFPPLLAALSKNQLELASELISRGACINVYLPLCPCNLSLLATENLESLKFILKTGAEVDSLFSSDSITILIRMLSEVDADIKQHLNLVLCNSFYISSKNIFPQEVYVLLSSKGQRMLSQIPSNSSKYFQLFGVICFVIMIFMKP